MPSVVADHLHFDVARMLEQLLEVEPAVFEVRLGFRLGGRERVLELGLAGDGAHALAAAARGGLEQHGIAELCAQPSRAASIDGSASVPGVVGDPARFMTCLAAALSPICAMTRRRRSR